METVRFPLMILMLTSFLAGALPGGNVVGQECLI